MRGKRLARCLSVVVLSVQLSAVSFQPLGVIGQSSALSQPLTGESRRPTAESQLLIADSRPLTADGQLLPLPGLQCPGQGQ